MTLVVGVVLLGCGGLTATPTMVVNAADPSLISVPGAYSFVSPDWIIADDTVIGVFFNACY